MRTSTTLSSPDENSTLFAAQYALPALPVQPYLHSRLRFSTSFLHVFDSTSTLLSWLIVPLPICGPTLLGLKELCPLSEILVVF